MLILKLTFLLLGITPSNAFVDYLYGSANDNIHFFGQDFKRPEGRSMNLTAYKNISGFPEGKFPTLSFEMFGVDVPREYFSKTSSSWTSFKSSYVKMLSFWIRVFQSITSVCNAPPGSDKNELHEIMIGEFLHLREQPMPWGSDLAMYLAYSHNIVDLKQELHYHYPLTATWFQLYQDALQNAAIIYPEDREKLKRITKITDVQTLGQLAADILSHDILHGIRYLMPASDHGYENTPYKLLYR